MILDETSPVSPALAFPKKTADSVALHGWSFDYSHSSLGVKPESASGNTMAPQKKNQFSPNHPSIATIILGKNSSAVHMPKNLSGYPEQDSAIWLQRQKNEPFELSAGKCQKGMVSIFHPWRNWDSDLYAY